ncbi:MULTISPECIES: YwiC-like family protein [Paenibacillus]|uniref:YwiC-like family protein n=1 Tax=Paenibacillus TaxID=44249 RepID=UPI002FE12050
MKPKYIPKQHGAWAMLIIPFLLGMFASGPGWLHGLLFIGWLLVYLFTFPLLQWIRTGKTRLYGKPMLLFGGLLIPVAVALIMLYPTLLFWIPCFLPLFLVNGYFARRNRERAFLNDLAAVVQFSLILFIAYQMGGGKDWRLAGSLFLLNILYFTGTIFYVKTIIREKNNPLFYKLSVGYHIASLVVCAVWFPAAMLIPLTVLLMRAVWLPKTKITVKRSGMLEIAFSLLFTVCTLVIL